MEAHSLHSIPSADIDKWYVDFANSLLPLLEKSELTAQMDRKDRAALYFTWYLEDCVNNSGSWKLFIRLHKQLYGRFLPFYAVTDSYVEDEINVEDVSLLLWMLLSRVADPSSLTDHSPLPWNPFDSSLLQLASDIFEVLDACFEQAPITDNESTDWLPELRALLPPTAPALNVLPGMTLPPDVETFLKHSNKKQIVYLKDYEEMCRFCVDKLMWGDDGDSFMPDLADEKDFVFFANPKGLLLAPRISACFRDECNTGYNREIAEREGFKLFYTPGLCPIDLLHYAMQHGLLPDAAFPFENGNSLLQENWDFIARRYLGKYYNEEFYEEKF